MLIIQKKTNLSESLIIIIIISLIFTSCLQAAPKNLEKTVWPLMPQHDIWGSAFSSLDVSKNEIQFDDIETRQLSENDSSNKIASNIFKLSDEDVGANSRTQHSKVLSFFPEPEKEECLSNDGRRYGTCYNVYECRKKGGQAKGDCNHGFGVCCVFTASCDQEITANMTYLLSPNFPSFMSTNLTICKIKIKLMHRNINQLRIDFHHMLLGQPNRKTGICDGDFLEISGGSGGPFRICGLNSGQHVFYDVGGKMASRQSQSTNLSNSNPIGGSNLNMSDSVPTSGLENDDIEMAINFANRAVPARFWEIRIMQIPFSQRAPSGCLQYFTGLDGIIQTFNFGDNGRHLANQNYRSCIRQEHGMCSITYEPCDEHSFRIGPNSAVNDNINNDPTVSNYESTISPLSNMVSMVNTPALSMTTFNTPTTMTTVVQSSETTPIIQADMQSSTNPSVEAVQADDTIEGSADNESNISIVPLSDAPPVTVGGFDILSFFRSTIFDFRRSRQLSFEQNRQFSLKCTDRITLPCIIEDFIGNSDSGYIGCEPVHCGMNFCTASGRPCRLESTVKPFYLGIHFGDGIGKGNADENIGACLRFNQMPCM